MRFLLSSLAVVLVVSGCSSTDVAPALPQTAGIGVAVSSRSVEASTSALTASLDALEPVSIVADVDHAAGATRVGLALPPTRELFFGNPMLGTPLMQRNQTAGIDLPQHIVLYEDGDARYAVYNTADYLVARHGLSGVATLVPIAEALDMLTAGASGGAVTLNPATGIAQGQGLVSVQSAFSVDETFERLRTAVEAAEPLSVAFELDHAANAARAGLELRPTRLLVFGNPLLGTPLMQSRRTVALDLPQRVLVWQDAGGTVRLTYNDPAFLAARHGITGQDETVRTIAEALSGLASAATTQR